jgi:starch-binding outer membrane protein SusE/F
MKRNLLLLFALIMIGFSSNAQVSLIGVGATGDWGVDADMVDQGGGLWALNAHTMPGGEFKFRLDHAWTTAWGNGLGGATFPVGVADTTPGETTNITAIAGTYDITFNQNTGEFVFSGGAPVSVVKIIGSATASPVSMITTDAENYTATNVTLVDGTAQFEIDATITLGGLTFPNGAAESFTDLIPVPAGVYSSIAFNLGSGVYSFTAAPVYPSIAIVGSGTPQGWPSDPQVDAAVLTTTDGLIYKGSVALIPGEIKFRSNNNWSDPNWGGVTFPTGPDAGNPGGNIVVPTAGYYDVVFERLTGNYTFSFPTIALVGSGTPQGWPSDPQVDAAVLTTTDGDMYLGTGIVLLDGEVKFRANNNWDVNWGAATFPSGTGTQGGANIPSTAGTYGVVFTRSTGAFNFDVLATKSFATSGFKAYPNPTTNNWNFASTKGNIQSVQIVDMLGKTILSVTPATANVTVDASALNAGVYFAKITTASATETVKVVKN